MNYLKIKAYVYNSYKLTCLSKFAVKNNISVIFIVKLLHASLKCDYIHGFYLKPSKKLVALMLNKRNKQVGELGRTRREMKIDAWLDI